MFRPSEGSEGIWTSTGTGTTPNVHKHDACELPVVDVALAEARVLPVSRSKHVSAHAAMVKLGTYSEPVITS